MKLDVNGREAYAYTGGKPFDAKLPTIVFVHGAMGDHGVWNLLARWFAHHGHSVLAVDLPGHMRSGGPALTSVEAMADWLLALLRAAGVTRATLVGHSMGSLIALEAAARTNVAGSVRRWAAPEADQPARGAASEASAGVSITIDRLVMIGTCVPMPVPQALLDLSRKDVHAAIDRVVSFSFSTLAAKPSFPGPGMWVQGAARSLMRMVAARSSDPQLFHTDFSACNQYVDGMTAATKVTCHAHLILGDFDQMTLARSAAPIADALKAKIHRASAGHYVMQEAPDDVLCALRAALT